MWQPHTSGRKSALFKRKDLPRKNTVLRYKWRTNFLLQTVFLQPWIFEVVQHEPDLPD